MGKRLGIPIAVAVALGIGLATLRNGSTTPGAFVNREVFNFGPVAGGPTPAIPTFAQSTLDGTPLAYLFYAKSDCSIACVTDDAQTPCPGIAWTGGSGATCEQAWNGLWALTDITDGNCWKFSSMTRSGAVFTGDFSLSVMNYVTAKESSFGMLSQIYETGGGSGNNGMYLRNESGVDTAVWFESGNFPSTTNGSTAITYYGWHLSTAHRKGTHHNNNINGGAENGDVVASNSMSPGGTIAGGIGCDNLGAGKGLGGAWMYTAVYSSDVARTQVNLPMARTGGVPMMPDGGAIAWPGTSTLICFDKADAGLAECMASGFPYVDWRGSRTWSGERTTSKWAADPLDVSSWTAVNSPGVVTNVKAGPFFEVLHSNEMDRVIDTDGTNFSGYKSTGNSFVRAPSAYTECVYLSVGDGGVSDKATLELTASHALFKDGGTVVDCFVSGLTNTPQLKSCTATLDTYDGGVDIRGAVYVGNAGSDTGSLTVGHARLNMGVTCEPAELGNAAAGDGYLFFDISNWHSDSAGGEHEVAWTPLSTAGSTSSTNSPYADWQEASSAIYLHDAYDNSSNHIVTFIHGYTLPGHLLMRFASIVNSTTVDLTADGINLTAGSNYVTAAKWLPTSGSNCTLSALEDTCSSAISSCVATTPIASGDGGCPDQPPNLKIAQRYDNTIPTDAWILSVRHKTP